jgi:hypothetical protein
LLLMAQMIAEELMPRDVTGVHARNGMIHEELGVDLGNASSCRDGSKSLPKIIAPLGKLSSVLPAAKPLAASPTTT